MFLAGFFASLLAVNVFAATTVSLESAATRTNSSTTTTALTTSSTQTVYLRFKVEGITATGSVITKATLRLYRNTGSSALTIKAANNSRSDSDSLLWWNSTGSLDNNPPHLANNPISPVGTSINGNWLEYDITDQYLTGDGLYSFAITSSGTNTYAAKGNSNEPQLVVNDSIKLDKATYAAIELLAQGPQIADRYDMASTGVVNDQSYFFKYGVIDATKQPYGAKPNDTADDRLAIQRAINDARLARAVVYLPSGTYLVSDTIELVQGSIDKDGITGRKVSPTERGYMIGHDPDAPEYAGSDLFFEKWTNAREFGNALMGKPGARAVLQLMDTATGFSFNADPGATTPVPPKPVLKVWSRWNVIPSGQTAADVDSNKNRSAVNYNQIVSNIDIDLNALAGTGGRNRGAAGITSGTAQGGVVSDCTITATNAFAGLYGSAGPGGGMHNVTVSGGEYGLYVGLPAEGQQALLSACTFTGQTQKAIYWKGLGGLTAVGTNITGKGIQVSSSQPWNGMLCLVDSKIDLSSSTGEAAVVSNRSVYMNRVYVKNGSPVITPDPALPPPSGAILSGSSWILINEYAGGVLIDQNPFDANATATGVAYYKSATNSGAMVKTANATLVNSVNVGAGVDFHNNHVWPDTPWFLDSEIPASSVISATATAYNAKGDGMSDDTAAIQGAIDFASLNGKNVFLPKGDYRISKSLHLPGAVKLFGIHKNYTFIQSAYSDRAANSPGDFYGTAAAAEPLVIGEGASCMLSDFTLVQRLTDARSYLLDWKAGPASVVKNVTFLRRPMEAADADIQPSETPMILVEGAATGGRFYHLWGAASSQKEPSPARHLKVSGTLQPLAFYMANFEYAHNLPQVEIVNAQHVDIFQSKWEGNYRNLHVNNSSDIRVFGVGGNASPFPSDIDAFTGAAYSGYKYANQSILIQDCTDFLIAGQSYQLRAPDSVTGYEAETPDQAANDAVYATSVGANSDPEKYDRLKETQAGVLAKKAPGIEQFVVYRRGNPIP